jgi:hypothetical protein
MLLAALCVTTKGGAAGALPSNPRAYALIVGSNRGGPGQVALKFAERDARRVRQVLTEIGAYAPENVKLLVAPTPEDVRGALDALKVQLEADQARGADATLFFFYSGHARANAMNLGDDALELADLRTRLTALPTALTIVVLDACQSGAFARVKGASAVADFSFNSVASLNTRGLAVMASSSSTELSQESDRLRSSYFTHYLLVALRGAGDENEDGRVSLDEAYRYAYAETLAATARTRVGGQHATLETKLTGQGDVAVTYPATESSQLVFPEAFEGQVLLQTRAHHAVVAEVTKVKGSPLRLALPPALYEGTVRRNGDVWSCGLDLKENQTTEFDLATCTSLTQEDGQAKGEVALRWPDDGDEEAHDRDASEARYRRRQEAWTIDAAIGGGPLVSDGYVARLQEFGYSQKEAGMNWAVGASRRILGPVHALARLRQFDQRSFRRDERSFEWTTYALSVGARATWDAGRAAFLYGQLELGPALGATHLRDSTTAQEIDDDQTHWGFFGEASAGLQMNAWRQGAIFLEGGYAYAPVVSNTLGDTHDGGGLRLLVGIRARIWGKP